MKNKIFNNKKAGEKIFSIWWFFVLIIVGVGIVAGVYVFYSADVDVREAEAEILYNKIADCITENGFLIDEILAKKENFDIYSKCDLSKNSIDKGNFYFRIFVFNESDDKISEIKRGNSAYEKDCIAVSLGKEEKAEKYPRCILKTEQVLYYDYSSNNEIKVKKAKLGILTASNNEGDRSAV